MPLKTITILKAFFALFRGAETNETFRLNMAFFIFSGNQFRRAVDGFGGGDEEPTTVAFMDPSRVAN